MKSKLQFIAAAACVAVLTACGGGAKAPTAVVVAQPEYKLTTTVVGTGLTAAAGDTVTFNYTGYLYDSTKSDLKGKVVDVGASYVGTVGVGVLPTVSLPAPGWDQALLGMQPGGKRTTVLPANLAYGANGRAETKINGVTYDAIPVNTPMVYDFELLNVTKAVYVPSTTFTDVKVGTGTAAVSGSAVTVTYTGWLYDATKADFKGTQFDTNVGGTPFAFTVGTGVVTGFSIGVTGMQVGGKRTVIVPPGQGYGIAGSGDKIPPNATLVFDIELLTVK
ncbi:FKBP-type peptidyl-prolyl cis-trans isomerase [Duganella radicis]|uniref:Peptidyl-prolyl cis-trans isomerase n=1 Tax=Duganella radicis TaxID=551988 RepID=A0A6L6PJD8_9BURK|nr:FKBP-type peptidyl-prolyl cis-trans isomerase [Duganella radicis]MTV39134.1 FKBP-type peptidylprolyl isomerase [Duganella radicis]